MNKDSVISDDLAKLIFQDFMELEINATVASGFNPERT